MPLALPNIVVALELCADADVGHVGRLLLTGGNHLAHSRPKFR
jgi:hypothetical protein